MPKVITPDELPKWVPGKLLTSSASLGWKDVAQRSYLYKGQEVPIPPLDHFMIVRYRNGHTPMYRQLEDSKGTRTTCVPGDISLLTNAQNSHWHWTQDIEVAHVYLSNALMSRVACDVLDRSVEDVRLHDVLQLQDPVLNAITDAINTEVRTNGLGGALYVEALGMQMAVHLLRRYASVTFSDPDDVGGLTSCQKRRLSDYIESHLHSSIRLEDLAQEVGLGVWTFSRKFKESFATSPHAFVTEQRVQKARTLLAGGRFAIKEVAYMCGFSDQAHLTRVIRLRLGTTPGQLKGSCTER